MVAAECFAAEPVWVLAFDKFQVRETGFEKSSSLGTTLSTQIPLLIAENFSSSQTRIIPSQEEADRKLSKYKDERISLYLQLDAAVKKRDGLVLQYYSDKTLKSKISEEEKNIADIKKKLEDNLTNQEKILLEIEEKNLNSKSKEEKTEWEKYLNLFKGLFSSKDEVSSKEKVALYEEGGSNFISVSEDILSQGYKSHSFGKKMEEKKINALITGSISFIEDYMSVTAELFLYPGSRSICAVTEVGNVSDSDFIARNIASRLVPSISSSLPVSFKINVEPAVAMENLIFSVDDVVYKSAESFKNLTVDSGVHKLRFESAGFRTVSTSYFFEGNETYEINVHFKESSDIKLNLYLSEDLGGSFYANGEFKNRIEKGNSPAAITINDNEILGLFVSEGDEGNSENKMESGFFYVPEKLVADGFALSVKPKVFNKNEFIETRRKWMYTSYSVFLVSFLASVYTYGNFVAYYDGYENSRNLSIAEEALKWNKAFWISGGITVAAGGFFAYELVRYFMAADSVLPVNAKKLKISDENSVDKNQEIEDTNN